MPNKNLAYDGMSLREFFDVLSLGGLSHRETQSILSRLGSRGVIFEGMSTISDGSSRVHDVIVELIKDKASYGDHLNNLEAGARRQLKQIAAMRTLMRASELIKENDIDSDLAESLTSGVS